MNCDALLDAEAGIKAVLSMHDIDEVVVIARAGSYDDNDEKDSVDLRQRKKTRLFLRKFAKGLFRMTASARTFGLRL